jgi:hypothetical protein
MFLRGPCRDVISKGESQLLGSSVLEAAKKRVARLLICEEKNLCVIFRVCNSMNSIREVVKRGSEPEAEE